jgi:riboflavin synthase
MFTGLVREVGTVVSFDDGRLRVESSLEAAIGDSVAIAGVCLTVVDGDRRTLAFDAVPETLERTTLGRLAAGSAVNVEPALRAGEELGGHYVQGHVDGTGRIRSVEPEGEGRRLLIDAPPEVLRYCVEKGSVAVDGVSLTIAAVDDAGFAVALVPHTLAVTTLGSAAVGDEVNLEADVLAKYVERLTRATI